MKNLLILAAALIFGNVWASEEDTDSCVYHGQHYYEMRLCDMFKKEQTEDDARKKEQEEYFKQARIKEAKAAEEQEKQRIASEAAVKKSEEEKARKIEESRLMLEKLGRDEDEQEAAKKHKCGKDYMKPHIGMTLARAEQCIGDFSLISQVNRKDGVVSTYDNGFQYISMMEGKIVSWHKY